MPKEEGWREFSGVLEESIASAAERVLTMAVKAGLVQGPYNPTIDRELASYLLYVERQLERGVELENVARIKKEKLSHFLHTYGFDLLSQIELLDARKGKGKWGEEDIVKGTSFYGMTILSAGTMPDNTYYVVSPYCCREEGADHYVIHVPDNIRQQDGWYVLNEEEAGAVRDALRTLLNERDVEQVWKGELEWENAEPILSCILNYNLLPKFGEREGKGEG